MGEKVCLALDDGIISPLFISSQDAKIKRLEQGPISSQLSSPLAATRAPTVRRTGVNHPLAMNQTKPGASVRSAVPTTQQMKVNNTR